MNELHKYLNAMHEALSYTAYLLCPCDGWVLLGSPHLGVGVGSEKGTSSTVSSIIGLHVPGTQPGACDFEAGGKSDRPTPPHSVHPTHPSPTASPHSLHQQPHLLQLHLLPTRPQETFVGQPHTVRPIISYVLLKGAGSFPGRHMLLSRAPSSYLPAPQHISCSWNDNSNHC